MSKRKFYKTVIKVEVLSDKPFGYGSDTLYYIASAIGTGNFPANHLTVEANVEANVVTDPNDDPLLRLTIKQTSH